MKNKFGTLIYFFDILGIRLIIHNESKVNETVFTMVCITRKQVNPPFIYCMDTYLNVLNTYLLFIPRGKESTKVRKLQIKGKKSENSYQELKRSRNDRHTQTYGNCIEIFRLVRPSFSVERE